MPWIEDNFLKYFTKDNKASYATKGRFLSLIRSALESNDETVFISKLTRKLSDTLSKTKVTGVKQVDNLQDGVNNTAGSVFGQGGIAQPVGDAFSKEGISRAERKGKDDKGQTAPGPLNKVADPIANQTKTGAGYISGAGQKISGIWSGKKEESK